MGNNKHKKIAKRLPLLIAILAAMCLTGCETGNVGGEETPPPTEAVIANEETKESEAAAEITSAPEATSEAVPETTTEAAPEATEAPSHNTMPSDVKLTLGGETIDNNALTEISIGEDGVWGMAKYEGVAFLAEPGETEYKKYAVGDEICGLKLISSYSLFMNNYLDNDYHEEFPPACFAELEGTLTMTGKITVAAEDGINLAYQKGDIMFFPDVDAIPLIIGTPANKYYDIFCGNIDGDVIPELLQLVPGEEVAVEITVSDIHLHSAPLAGEVSCTIDSVSFK